MNLGKRQVKSTDVFVRDGFRLSVGPGEEGRHLGKVSPVPGPLRSGPALAPGCTAMSICSPHSCGDQGY
jgi:hypothetical protein